MDHHDRLWAELIFPWCGGSTLLQLRAVCRAFRGLLKESLLWLPWTLELLQLRYDERIDGWRGVMRGMQREANTRANCETGRFILGPLLEIDGWRAIYVAGRIAAFHHSGVNLFDPDTGALVASFKLERPELGVRSTGNNIVLDRWVPFCVAGGRGLLLDCVAARLVGFAPLDPGWGSDFRFSTAGACLSWRRRGRSEVTVMRFETTTWREVARVWLAHLQVQFGLCEHGHSYLLFDQQHRTLRLMDLATGLLKRAFNPRTPPPFCGGDALARSPAYTLCAPAAALFAFFAVVFFADCDFVLARTETYLLGGDTAPGAVTFRISG